MRASRRPREFRPQPANIGATETGIASWYGVPYDGRRAASGEIYDMEQLTAAHRTLPFRTWVEVTNLDNGKRVNVRINDRGPFVDGRIIDLSLAAAREIEMVGPGIARVRLKVIAPPRGSEKIATQKTVNTTPAETPPPQRSVTPAPVSPPSPVSTQTPVSRTSNLLATTELQFHRIHSQRPNPIECRLMRPRPSRSKPLLRRPSGGVLRPRARRSLPAFHSLSIRRTD